MGSISMEVGYVSNDGKSHPEDIGFQKMVEVVESL